jgi:predicted  nucleic acid-binding Zn-ribbon protein
MQSAAIGMGLFVAGAAAALELRREIKELEKKVKASQSEQQRARPHAMQRETAMPSAQDGAPLAALIREQEKSNAQQAVLDHRLSMMHKRVDRLEDPDRN